MPIYVMIKPLQFSEFHGYDYTIAFTPCITDIRGIGEPVTTEEVGQLLGGN